MNTILRAAIFYTFITGIVHVSYAQSTSKVPWPKGKEAAISLSFDDARFSQVDRGTALLDSMQVKATFTWFLPPQNKEWKAGRKPLLPVMKWATIPCFIPAQATSNGQEIMHWRTTRSIACVMN